jgi:hypothetical protein
MIKQRVERISIRESENRLIQVKRYCHVCARRFRDYAMEKLQEPLWAIVRLIDQDGCNPDTMRPELKVAVVSINTNAYALRWFRYRLDVARSVNDVIAGHHPDTAKTPRFFRPDVIHHVTQVCHEVQSKSENNDDVSVVQTPRDARRAMGHNN